MKTIIDSSADRNVLPKSYFKLVIYSLTLILLPFNSTLCELTDPFLFIALFHFFFALEIAIVLDVGKSWKLHLKINKCV